MPQKLEKPLLVLLDFFVLNIAFLTWAWLRREMGFFAESDFSTLLQISIVFNTVWVILFTFTGLYSFHYAKSRIDEFISIFKTISLGVLILFLITFEGARDLATPPRLSRMFIANYWLVLLICMSSSRLIFRTIQRALLTAGIGHRRTLIVGWGKKSWALVEELKKFPALGYNIIGFIAESQDEAKTNDHYKSIPLLGNIQKIDQLIEESKAQEVILALKGNTREKALDIMAQCNGATVKFKIVPDMYDIVIGQMRTNQIYGLPLIDIEPRYMPAWEQQVKRLMDIFFSAIVLIGFLPVWGLIAIIIKLESQGPALYKQERVGLNGKKFMIYKFRSMVQDAESKSGPQWATKEDPRITRLGKLLRKARIDEIPQFINILAGEMSLIGPRPERPFFVDQFKKEIPFYARRLKVKPGLTGWAQIKGGYDTSIENVKEKLQFDLFYLENMSLRMDMKVIFNTIYIMLRGKGH